MKEKSLLQNYIFNLIYQVVAIALPLVTTPYLSHVLGAEPIGQYSFAQSIVSYFALFAALGTTLYGQRQIAQAKNDPAERSRLFWEIFLFRLAGALLAAVVYCCTIMPTASAPLLYAVAAIEILTVAFDITWFYQGVENFAPIAACVTFARLLITAGVFLLVKTKEDLVLYVLLYCISLLVGNLLSWIGLRKYLVRPQGIRLHILVHLLPALALFVSQFAVQIYTVLDKTMIGLITGSDFENGYYEQSQKLVRVLVAVVNSMGAVMASRVAVLWHSEKRREAQELIVSSFRFAFCLGLPMAVGVCLIISRFVPIFYGAEFEPVTPIIMVLTLLFPIMGCSNVIGIQYLVPTGREKWLTVSVLCGAGINVILNIFFIYRWQAMGAAIASVIAELAVTVVQFIAVRREIKALPVLKALLRYGIFTAIMGAAGYGISLVVPHNIWGIALIVLPCVAIYGILLLVTRDPVIRFFLNRNVSVSAKAVPAAEGDEEAICDASSKPENDEKK